ncbi:phage tail domain-containing protein [Lacticaseibacillus rhamnosus]|uniref:phage tail domain-containing protein n=1 Tax=Lacticaseibacillus rhamnosus TaxID=47715 RepID=UPI00237F37D6|nr:phage tail domain-containing protein [Lacticaseibacillus rhamnosus]MDE3295914.1 phage tail family protein [Lacticaseibacillus rhamnosus]
MSAFYDFKFLDKRPVDINPLVRVKDREIGIPDKEKTVETIPFSNTVFDFSGLYGGQKYSERTIKYVINIVGANTNNQSEVHRIKTQLINWLMGPNKKQPLYDDKYPDYYFLAEVQANDSFSENPYTGELTVTFTCYPFMIRTIPEGDDNWDTFDLEDGVAQAVDYTISGSQSFSLINPSIAAVACNITVTGGPIELTVNGVKYSLAAGTNTGVSLPNGTVNLAASGSGTLHFDWRREVI